jgi:hypothetical protein
LGGESAVGAGGDGVKIGAFAFVDITEIGHLVLDPDDGRAHAGGLEFTPAEGAVQFFVPQGCAQKFAFVTSD